MRLILLVFALLLCALSQEIRIGVSLTLTQTPPTARLVSGRATRDGILLFLEEMGNEPVTIGNTNYTWAATIMDDEGNLTIARTNYETMLNDSSIQFFLGGVNSDMSLAAKGVTEPAKRLLIGTTAAISVFYSGKYSFSMTTAAKNFGNTAVPEMRVKQVKTLVTMTEVHVALDEVCRGVDDAATSGGIEVVARLSIPFSLDGWTSDEQANMTATMEYIRSLNPDALFACVFQDTQPRVAQLLKEMNWVPKLATMVPENTLSWLTTDNHTKDFVTGLSLFEGKATWATDGRNFGNPRMYSEKFMARFGYEPDSFAATGTAGMLVLRAAIRKALTLDTDTVRDAVRTLAEDTFMGRFSFGADHACQVPAFMTQFQNGVREVVAPVTAATHGLVYPMPTFQERIFVNQVGHPLEIVVIVLTCLGIIVAFGLLGSVIYYRKHSIMIASSPTFLVGMLVGSLIIMASNFPSMPHLVQHATCHLQIWMLALGFVIMFGSLVVKTWRVWHLYSNASVQVIRVSDSQLVVILSILVGISTILLVLISGVTNPMGLLQEPDEFRAALSYYACRSTSPTAFTALLAVLLAYNGLLILVGLYYAYRVRVIPLKAYDESKIIGFSIYNFGIVAVVIAILELVQVADRYALFGIRGIGIVLSALLTIGAVMNHKLGLIRRGATARGSTTPTHTGSVLRTTKSHSTSYKSSSEPSSGADAANELSQLKEKYAKLKHKYQKLKDKMNEVNDEASGDEDEEEGEKQNVDSGSSDRVQ